MSNSSHDISILTLMQPELLPEKELRSILTQRCIKMQDMQQMNKEQLLNLYHRLVMPLEQRTDNRRVVKMQPKRTQNIQAIPKEKIVTDCENGVKKLKLNNTNRPDKVVLKRTHVFDKEDAPTSKKVRQRICWP